MKYLTLIFLILLCACGDVSTSKYQTYQEAKDDRLFERGWLPDILPSTTINILTKNDLDLNRSSGHFTIPKENLNDFLNLLNKIEIDKFKYQDVGRNDWWVFTVKESGYVSYTMGR